MNRFLAHVADHPDLQLLLSNSDPQETITLAKQSGYDICLGDLIRYKSRSTPWALTNEELDIVYAWNPDHGSYWWQSIWKT